MIDNSQQKMRRYKTPSQSRGQDIGARGGRGRNLDSRRGGPSNRHFARGSGRGSAKSWNK